MLNKNFAYEPVGCSMLKDYQYLIENSQAKIQHKTKILEGKMEGGNFINLAMHNRQLYFLYIYCDLAIKYK